MRSLSEFGLLDSHLDDILLFWRSADQRRAVVSWDYGATQDYLSRLLRKLDAQSHEQTVASGLTALRESGRVLPLALGGQWIGLMRPLLLGERSAVRATKLPFLISFEGRGTRGMPDFPVVCTSRDEAVALVRKLNVERGIDQQLWRQYESELLLNPIEKLLMDLHRGNRVTAHRTELERLLLSVVHADRVRRAPAGSTITVQRKSGSKRRQESRPISDPAPAEN
jgi:hypothetical protein